MSADCLCDGGCMTIHAPRMTQMVSSCKDTNGGLMILSEQVRTQNVSRPDYTEIGDRLRAVRLAYAPDSTQASWAGTHGFSRTQYSNWENGIRRISLDAAERLCSTYGLTLDFLFMGRRDGLSENARKAVSEQRPI